MSISENSVFLGGTALMAWMDSGLSTLIGAITLCGITYVVQRRRANDMVDTVHADQVASVEAQVHAEKDPERKKAMRREGDAQLKKAAAINVNARLWNHRGAQLVGVGTLANPAVGVVVLATQYEEKWMPTACALGEIMLDVVAGKYSKPKVTLDVPEYSTVVLA